MDPDTLRDTARQNEMPNVYDPAKTGQGTLPNNDPAKTGQGELRPRSPDPVGQYRPPPAYVAPPIVSAPRSDEHDVLTKNAQGNDPHLTREHDNLGTRDGTTSRPVEAKPAVAKPANVPEPTKQERGAALVASYASALDHNSPRTASELNELRYLLGCELKHEPLTDMEKAMMVKPVTRVKKAGFVMGPLGAISPMIPLNQVPRAVSDEHHELRGLSYFVVDDDIHFVDSNRHVIDMSKIGRMGSSDPNVFSNQAHSGQVRPYADPNENRQLLDENTVHLNPR